MNARAALLARARAAAEAGMVDTCTISRPLPDTTDPVTGEVTKDYDLLYPAQKCRFQQSYRPSADRREVGEASILLLSLELQLPISVIGLQPEDVVVCDTSAYDPDLPGRRFVVQVLAHKTEMTARRVQLTEVTS